VFAGALRFGLGDPLHIREETLSAGSNACRLLYVSDIHLRPSRAERLARQVVEATRRAAVQVVLLGGDLVDHRSQLGNLRDLVRELSVLAPVFAVGGNHDCAIGLDLISDAVRDGGGSWIHSGAATLQHGSRTIAIAGPEAEGVPVGDYRILCGHNPRIWKKAKRSGYDLVLSGHLHGCQVVAFELGGRLFPGAMFYPYCFIRRQERLSRLIVSRGVSDLFPIRWRCPREVVLCHI
jgi:predicted MPP superfamily phosphohydrolase